MAEGSSIQELVPPSINIRSQNRKTSQSEHIVPQTAYTDFLKAETGKPFRGVMFRGLGRKDKSAPYTDEVPKEPIFGDAIYSSPNPFFASRFGPIFEKFTVTLKNPLVIHNDKEWEAITKTAGLLTNTPMTHKEVQQLRRAILAKGYDGVIINVPFEKNIPFENRRGNALRATFMESTVVDFGGVFLNSPVPVSPKTEK